jgi:hypothetical protein
MKVNLILSKQNPRPEGGAEIMKKIHLILHVVWQKAGITINKLGGSGLLFTDDKSQSVMVYLKNPNLKPVIRLHAGNSF